MVPETFHITPITRMDDDNFITYEVGDNKITVSTWFYTWLFDYRKQDLKPKSFQRYHGIYTKYIENTDLGNIKLNDLRTTHLQRYYKKLI